MSNTNIATGKWGEHVAESFLKARSLTIIGRNVRTKYGEIDLIAQKDQTLIFFEVKTRSNLSFGKPEEAITEKKLGHMLQSAEAYIQENALEQLDWRIDVIAIIGSPNKINPEIRWFENVAC